MRPAEHLYSAGREESWLLLPVIGSTKMFGKVIRFVTFSQFPVVVELFPSFW